MRAIAQWWQSMSVRLFGSTSASEPWFRQRRGVSIAVAAVLYVAIFLLRQASKGPADATMLFFVLPVALLAVTFGLLGGLIGGVIAVDLLVVWVLIENVSLSPIGWITRALPVVLLGLLLGHATDRLIQSETERQRLDKAAHWHRQAVDINDSIVQGLAAAKWSLESGKYDSGLATVSDTLDQAQQLVSQLFRDADMGLSGAHAPGQSTKIRRGARKNPDAPHG